MSLGSFFKKQFIDVIGWTEDAPGVLQYRFPMQDMEIQNGAQLTVRESQMAVFVNEGKIADIFQPGMYTLETKNLPVDTVIIGIVDSVHADALCVYARQSDTPPKS